MKLPLEFFPAPLRKPFFYLFLALTLAIFAVFNCLDQPLRTSAAPNGIVSLELAYDPLRARGITDSWDADAKLAAAFGLGFDFLFMPVYALALSFGLLLVRQPPSGLGRSLLGLAAWGALAAPLFDAAENFCLWRILAGDAAAPYSQIAAVCASIKFALLAFGLLAAALSFFPRRA